MGGKKVASQEEHQAHEEGCKQLPSRHVPASHGTVSLALFLMVSTASCHAGIGLVCMEDMTLRRLGNSTVYCFKSNRSCVGEGEACPRCRAQAPFA